MLDLSTGCYIASAIFASFGIGYYIAGVGMPKHADVHALENSVLHLQSRIAAFERRDARGRFSKVG